MKVLCYMPVILGLLLSSGDASASLSKADMKADLVVVKKSQYSLTLMKGGKPIKRY